LQIYTPSSTSDFESLLEIALTKNQPVVIRYPKNGLSNGCEYELSDRLWSVVKESNNDKVSIIAVGPRTLKIALEVADKVQGVKVVIARSIKPIDEETLSQIKDNLVITLEENSVIGGFGSIVRDFYANNKFETKVLTLGIKDEFVKHGSVEKQLADNGLSADNIINIITETV
jgi:1-deoxy-D-xylulose-5-phosphate synthase